MKHIIRVFDWKEVKPRIRFVTRMLKNDKHIWLFDEGNDAYVFIVGEKKPTLKELIKLVDFPQADLNDLRQITEISEDGEVF